MQLLFFLLMEFTRFSVKVAYRCDLGLMFPCVWLICWVSYLPEFSDIEAKGSLLLSRHINSEPDSEISFIIFSGPCVCTDLLKKCFTAFLDLQILSNHNEIHVSTVK